MTRNAFTEDQARALQQHPASPALATFQGLAEEPERLALAHVGAEISPDIAEALAAWQASAEAHDTALLEHAEAWDAFLSAPARHAAAVDAAARGVAEVPTAPDLPALSVAAEVARARVGHAYMATRRAARAVDTVTGEHASAIADALAPSVSSALAAWRSAWSAFVEARSQVAASLALYREAEATAALSVAPRDAVWTSAVYGAVRDVNRAAGLSGPSIPPNGLDALGNEYAGCGDLPPSIRERAVLNGRASGALPAALRLSALLGEAPEEVSGGDEE